MKSLPAFILLLAFAWTQAYNTVVLTAYELNKVAIEKEFCENKAKPELKCNGKCHLSKQLLDHQKEPQQNEPPTLLPQQDLFAYQWNAISINNSIKAHTNIFKTPSYQFLFSKGLEKPPRV